MRLSHLRCMQPAGCSHQPFIHVRSRSPLRKKVDGGSSISHDEDRIHSDLGLVPFWSPGMVSIWLSCRWGQGNLKFQHLPLHSTPKSFLWDGPGMVFRQWLFLEMMSNQHSSWKGHCLFWKKELDMDESTPFQVPSCGGVSESIWVFKYTNSHSWSASILCLPSLGRGLGSSFLRHYRGLKACILDGELWHIVVGFANSERSPRPGR